MQYHILLIFVLKCFRDACPKTMACNVGFNLISEIASVPHAHFKHGSRFKDESKSVLKQGLFLITAPLLTLAKTCIQHMSEGSVICPSFLEQQS